MQLKHNPNIHLSYCSNVHPGSTWEEIRAQLRSHIPELKKRLSPDAAFGIGLRLSARSAYELQKKDVLDEFRKWLNRENLYVFTINGFVYGSFHGKRVKDEVYKPDWGSDKRLTFTRSMIQILAELIPEGGEGSISTSPVSYKYWDLSEEESGQITEKASKQMAILAFEMAKIYNEKKKLIHIDIEPEPDCHLETMDEAVDFFTGTLFPVGMKFLKETHSLSESDAMEILKRHIRICFDTCHVALEYEAPEESIRKLQNAGIQIGKVQISSALKVELPIDRETVAEQLRQFVEPVYLHQVLARQKDGTINQYRDLDVALNHINDPDAAEWRVHFHVPVFLEQYGLLSSTHDDTLKSLQTCLKPGICNHFEIETYTWEVLPSDLKMDVTDSIERELRWALKQMNLEP